MGMRREIFLCSCIIQLFYSMLYCRPRLKGAARRKVCSSLCVFSFVIDVAVPAIFTPAGRCLLLSPATFARFCREQMACAFVDCSKASRGGALVVFHGSEVSAARGADADAATLSGPSPLQAAAFRAAPERAALFAGRPEEACASTL